MVLDQEFRDVMASVCAPVTVVTALVDGQPHGTTVSAFASLSLTPPMVSVALDRRSTALAMIQRTGRFGVNVLGHGQDELALVFARRDVDRFAAADWHLDHGLPRLAGAASWLVCELTSAVDGGDHLLLLGTVTHAGRTESAPLVYGHRIFGTHSHFADPAHQPG